MPGYKYDKIIRSHLGTAYLLSEEKIDSVLPGFINSLDTLMQNLEDAAMSGGIEKTSRAGHAVKGALLSLGLRDLAQKALQIEKESLAGLSDSNLRVLVNELAEEISVLVAHLRQTLT